MMYNIVQSITNDLQRNIKQENYKYPMKININMAIGFVKRFLLKILLEDNEVEKQKLSELLIENIKKTQFKLEKIVIMNAIIHIKIKILSIKENLYKNYYYSFLMCYFCYVKNKKKLVKDKSIFQSIFS